MNRAKSALVRRRPGLHGTLPPAAQRGIALIMLLAIVTMGSLFLFLGNLSPVVSNAYKQWQTDRALREAAEALKGYAWRYRDAQLQQTPPVDDQMYGWLPLPDLGSTRNQNISSLCVSGGTPLEGCDANTATGISFDGNGVYPTIIGRFPWRTLGTGPLRDGAGECLWVIVSSLHGRIHRTSPTPTPPPLNWDTLGQLDIVVADGQADLRSLLAPLNQTADRTTDPTRAHERPIAIIFAPGPILAGQNRAPAGNGDDITECGGNYDARNYLDPVLASSTGNTTNYLGGTNNASGLTGDSDRSNDPDTPKNLLAGGKVSASGGLYLPSDCTRNACAPLSNDAAFSLTAEQLFAEIRNYSPFRNDINAMLARMNGCLADQIKAGSLPGTYAGRVPANACYADTTTPKGYYSHYAEQTFLVKPAAGTYTVNGQACAGALIFAGQRAAGQSRITSTQRTGTGYQANYLEGINQVNFATGSEFSGPTTFDRVSIKQSASQDIVQCLSTSGSLASVQSAALTAAGIAQLSAYNPATSSLRLGNTTSTAYPTGTANNLYGCTWQPDPHPMSGGMRSYFKFRINDLGTSSNAAQGFTFTLTDSDNNDLNACGGPSQHLGYSGRNTETAFIAPPKIAFEIDPSRNSGFNTNASNSLTNGRADPAYSGGHVGLVYWGSENSAAAVSPVPGTCAWPRDTRSGACALTPEQDDNVHGRLSGVASTRTAFPIPPVNPAAPASGSTQGGGVYKLDPSLSSVPVNKDFHVRMEVTRAPPRLTPARVATTGAISLAAPGASIDGVTLTPNDRVLVKNQSPANQNGVYRWNGAASAMTRSSDADTGGELEGALVEVVLGTTNTGSVWKQTSTSITVGTTSISWTRTRTPKVVRLATTDNVTLGAPGATMDGVSLVSGNRVLLKNQRNASENGLYVWSGAGSTLTRTGDANTAGELDGSLAAVSEGVAYAGTLWKQTSTNIVLNTSAIAWAPYQSIEPATGVLAVRLASTGNVNLNSDVLLVSPFSRIDGVALAAGDRVLLKDQTTAAENGVYYVKNVGTDNSPQYRFARTDDADSAVELTGTVVEVSQGVTNARSLWRQGVINPAPDSTDQLWSNTRVKVATAMDVNLGNPQYPYDDTPNPPYNSIDGIRLNVGDRVLVRAQTLPAQNGVYVWNGAGVAMTRATDAVTPTQRAAMAVQVQQGSLASAWFTAGSFDSWNRVYATVSAQVPITLASPGASIDGVSQVVGDLVLLRNQAAAAENGIWQWNGAAVAMTRAAAFDTASELAGAVIQVVGGTDAGRSFRQNLLSASGSLGTDPVAWAALDGAAQYQVEVWILPDSPTTADQITAMKNTTRPMSQLYPTFSAQVRGAPTIGYPFRNARIGFTTGQATTVTDQNFTISDITTTWLQ